MIPRQTEIRYSTSRQPQMAAGEAGGAPNQAEYEKEAL